MVVCLVPALMAYGTGSHSFLLPVSYVSNLHSRIINIRLHFHLSVSLKIYL